jgi:hypothetical protein
MTLPQISLCPARSNDGRSLLRTLQLVASGRLQLAQVVGAVVGQGMAFEPRPQIFHRIEVWRVGRQKCNLDMSVQAVEIVAHDVAAVRLGPIPDHQQGLFEMSLEGFEEFDKLFLLDAALVQAKQAVA